MSEGCAPLIAVFHAVQVVGLVARESGPGYEGVYGIDISRLVPEVAAWDDDQLEAASEGLLDCERVIRDEMVRRGLAWEPDPLPVADEIQISEAPSVEHLQLFAASAEDAIGFAEDEIEKRESEADATAIAAGAAAYLAAREVQDK